MKRLLHIVYAEIKDKCQSLGRKIYDQEKETVAKNISHLLVRMNQEESAARKRASVNKRATH